LSRSLVAEQFWGIDMSKARLRLILCSGDADLMRGAGDTTAASALP